MHFYCNWDEFWIEKTAWMALMIEKVWILLELFGLITDALFYAILYADSTLLLVS